MSRDAESRTRPLGAWVFGCGLLALLGLGALITQRPAHGRLAYSQRRQAETMLVSLQSALNEFALREGGRYPNQLEALVELDEHGNTFLGSKELPLDPWNRRYVYTVYGDGDGFSLFTLGADGKTGGTGKDEDHSIVCMPSTLTVDPL